MEAPPVEESSSEVTMLSSSTLTVTHRSDQPSVVSITPAMPLPDRMLVVGDELEDEDDEIEELFEEDDEEGDDDMDVIEEDGYYYRGKTSSSSQKPSSSSSASSDPQNDDNNSEYVVWGNVRRRKPKRIKRYIPAPRVVKADIRRKYNTMLANCMNSYDIDFIKSFFDSFGISNEKFSYHLYVKPALTDTTAMKRDPAGNVDAASSSLQQYSLANLRCDLKMNSLDAFLWFIAAVQCITPDRSVSYSNIKIHTFSSSAKSYIEAEFVIEGSMLYNIQISELVKEAFFIDKEGSSSSSSNPNDAKGKGKGKAVNTVPPISPSTPLAFPNIETKEIAPFLEQKLKNKNLPRIIKPNITVLKGKIMIFLDENRRIERIAQISEI